MERELELMKLNLQQLQTNMHRNLISITRLTTLAAFLLSVSPKLTASDWPQWRGQNRDGIAKETGLLKTWPANGPPLLWQVKDLGSGYSTPSVAAGRLYVMSNKGVDDEFVKALDMKDGKQEWSTRIGKVGNPDQEPNYPAARSTPTVDGKRLYALGSDGDLVCLETSNGKVHWQKSLRADFAVETIKTKFSLKQIRSSISMPKKNGPPAM